MKKKGSFIETKKDIIKVIRSSLELLSIIIVLVLVIRAMFFFSDYVPYDENDSSVVTGEDHGFLALSYLGVDRDGTDTLISTKRLEQELGVLHELGYVTVTQQDIYEYYYDHENKKLPEKALYLMFEDGRKDTAMFAEKLLEKFNYRATVMTYASNLEITDNTFLSPKDIRKLEKDGFCELGTNGYRLAYINAYDRHDRFLGQLTAKEYVKVRPFLRRDYNHYLMDFIRDENRIPVESSAQMRERIDYDYDKMEEIYTREFKRVPLAYAIMQANTGRFGNNDKVSDRNREDMGRIFSLNFNREGFSLNDAGVDEYDLTRMQPQAYWYVNHLLMRIRDDLDEDEKDWIRFVSGNAARASKWEVSEGAAEFDNDLIALTSLPGSHGKMTLKAEGGLPESVYITAELMGNVLGEQTIALCGADDGGDALEVSLQDDHIIIKNSRAGNTEVLYDYDLYELTPEEDRISVEEDDANALQAELNARSRFSEDMKESVLFYFEGVDASVKSREEVVTYEDGGEEFVEEFDINDKGDRKVGILLSGDELSVTVDGVLVADRIDVSDSVADREKLSLICGVPDEDYSQRNLTDDVYDGVFKELAVYAVNEGNEEISSNGGKKTVYECFAVGRLKKSDKRLSEYYDNSLKGFERFKDKNGRFWNMVINWFVKNL